MNSDTKTNINQAANTSNISGSRSNVTVLALCALFTALTAICSWISIPLPFTPVPVNLATFAVMLSGCILGPVYGTLAQIVYVLLGAIGAPVFSGGAGGLGIIAGPTGGYIICYMILAAVCGFITHMNSSAAKPSIVKIALAMILGTLLLYTAGTIWFMYVTGNKILPSLMMCVVPYLPGDALKMIVGIAIIKRLPRSFLQ